MEFFGDFLTFIMETVLFPYRNYDGNFHLSINVKWHVTREWEEFRFRGNGISLVIFQTRIQVFHCDFKQRENYWNTRASGPECFIVFELFVMAMKHAEWVFGITSQTNEMESIVFPGICALWNALPTNVCFSRCLMFVVSVSMMEPKFHLATSIVAQLIFTTSLKLIILIIIRSRIILIVLE